MNKTNNTGCKTYSVRYTLNVDRPELRGPSYRPVAAGTRVQQTATFTTQGAALRFMEGLRAGEEDFASEFITSMHASASNGSKVRYFGGAWMRTRGEAWERKV